MENSGEGVNKLEEKDAVDYSLVLSEIYHRVIETNRKYSEEAYRELLSEIKDLFTEVGFTDESGGIEYSSENHDYFLHKKEIFDSTELTSYKDLFWKGFIVRHSEDDYFEESDKNKNVVKNDSSPEALSDIDESYPFRNIGTILNPTSDDEMRYDMFSVKSSKFVVNLIEGNSDSEKRFSLFFNWYLSTLSSYEIKPFLEYHFKNDFASDLQNFKRFIKLTIAEDQNEVIPEFLRELAFEEVDKFRIYEIEANPLSGLTQNQVVLLVYFYLESMGVEKSLIDKSSVARFIHLLVGKPLTKLQNSNIYAKVKKYPNFVEDKYLKDDLIIVKKILDDFGLSIASQLVIVEISRCS